MRSVVQLIRLVLGDPSFEGLEESASPLHTGEGFKLFRAYFKAPRYRGFPDVWDVAVRTRPDERTSTQDQTRILDEGREICERAIRLQNRKQPRPLLLISDDPNVRLGGKLLFRGELVFCLDARNLPDRQSEEPAGFRFSPLVSAVRSKLDRQELSRFLVAPYQPHDPAVGWRFFGRDAELEKLVESNANFFVIGPRRVGKTSLLQETKRRLEARGTRVFLIACQYMEGPAQVVEEILRSLDARSVATATRRARVLDESMLPAVIKTVMRRHQKVVLILDELGNAIRKHDRDPWEFMGALREFSQSGNLRIIMSGWQQIYRKQGEFESPFVNFAAVLPIKGFKDPEIRQCLIDPLSLWGTIRDHDALCRRVSTQIGRQPFLVQFFGAALYSRVLEEPDSDVDSVAERILEEDFLDVFLDAVDEIFFRFMPSPVQRYLFLKACHEADTAGKALHTAEISDTWIRSTLAALGLDSTLDDRREAMEALELRGLTEPIGHLARRHHVSAPIVYRCIKEANEPVEELIEILAEEMVGESS